MENDVVVLKAFWNFVKPFLINEISSLENDVLTENGQPIFEANTFLEMFNDHCVNNVEKSCKIKPQSFGTLSSATDDENVINLFMTEAVII